MTRQQHILIISYQLKACTDTYGVACACTFCFIEGLYDTHLAQWIVVHPRHAQIPLAHRNSHVKQNTNKGYPLQNRAMTQDIYEPRQGTHTSNDDEGRNIEEMFRGIAKRREDQM